MTKRLMWAMLGLTAVTALAGIAFVACGSSGGGSGGGGHNAGDDDASSESWTDPATGLRWEIVPTSGDADLAGVRAHCAGLTLDGKSGWRLPTITELRTLVRGCPGSETSGSCGVTDQCVHASCGNSGCSGCAANGGSSNGCYWPPQLSGTCTIDDWYWTSSVTSDIDSSVWTIGFDTGNITYVATDSTIQARCVWSAAADDDDDDTDVWVDASSGHMWQVNPPGGSMDQAAAAAYCVALTLAGHSDWRLPDIDALRSLIRGCSETVTGGPCNVTDQCLNASCQNSPCDNMCASGGNNGCYWPSQLGGTCDWYWSSSLVADANTNGYVVNYYGGGVENFPVSEADVEVRCVR